MRKPVTFSLVFWTGILFLSCDSSHSIDPGSAYLRISNMSQLEFNSVYVSFPGVEFTIEDIEPGTSSSYQQVENVYRYGFIEIQSEQGEYRLQPIDFVGEEPLESGRYTYQLDIDEESLTLNLIRD